MFDFISKNLQDIPCISLPKMIVLSIVLSVLFAHLEMPILVQEVTGIALWIWWLTSYFNFRECKSHV